VWVLKHMLLIIIGTYVLVLNGYHKSSFFSGKRCPIFSNAFDAISSTAGVSRSQTCLPCAGLLVHTVILAERRSTGHFHLVAVDDLAS